MIEVREDIEINSTRESVWNAISDIENCGNMISSIMKIEILNMPLDSLVGLKWKETREMFGKQATETMWITDATTNEYYSTRAESHGAIYISKLSLADCPSGTLLAMSFRGNPQTMTAKVLSFLMIPFMRKAMGKTIAKDLADIKRFVELE
jgi:hypothetical protein